MNLIPALGKFRRFFVAPVRKLGEARTLGS